MEKTDHLERMAVLARSARLERMALRDWLERMEHGAMQVRQGRPDPVALLASKVRQARRDLPAPRGPKGMRVRPLSPAQRARRVRS